MTFAPDLMEQTSPFNGMDHDETWTAVVIPAGSENEPTNPDAMELSPHEFGEWCALKGDDTLVIADNMGKRRIAG